MSSSELLPAYYHEIGTAGCSAQQKAFGIHSVVLGIGWPTPVPHRQIVFSRTSRHLCSSCWFCFACAYHPPKRPSHLVACQIIFWKEAPYSFDSSLQVFPYLNSVPNGYSCCLCLLNLKSSVLWPFLLFFVDRRLSFAIVSSSDSKTSKRRPQIGEISMNIKNIHIPAPNCWHPQNIFHSSSTHNILKYWCRHCCDLLQGLWPRFMACHSTDNWQGFSAAFSLPSEIFSGGNCSGFFLPSGIPPEQDFKPPSDISPLTWSRVFDTSGIKTSSSSCSAQARLFFSSSRPFRLIQIHCSS